MRKAISFVAIAMVFCLSASVMAQKKPIEIGKKEFLAKVVNYEKDATSWNYLGDKPAIIDFYADFFLLVSRHIAEVCHQGCDGAFLAQIFDAKLLNLFG